FRGNLVQDCATEGPLQSSRANLVEMTGLAGGQASHPACPAPYRTPANADAIGPIPSSSNTQRNENCDRRLKKNGADGTISSSERQENLTGRLGRVWRPVPREFGS